MSIIIRKFGYILILQIMAKYKYCKDCGKEINSSQSKCCGYCIDIRLYGSKEKAREVSKKNFELIGIKAT